MNRSVSSFVVVVLAGIGLGAFASPAAKEHPQSRRAQEKAKARAVDVYGDPLPEGVRARLGTVRLRHRRVTDLVFSADGKTLYTIGLYDGLRCWDPATGRELQTIPIRQQKALALALSPDGKLLAVGGKERTVGIYKLPGGKEVAQLEGHLGSVSAVAFSPDGRLLASRGVEDPLRIWDIGTGKEIRQLASVGTSFCRDIVFAADGVVITSQQGYALQAWSLKTGRELKRFQQIDDEIYTLTQSSDNKLLVGGGAGTLQFWNLATGKQIRSLKDSVAIRDVCFSPKKQLLAVSNHDDLIRLFDGSTGEKLWEIKLESLGGRLAFSPDGATLAVGQSGAIRLIDTASGKERHSATKQHISLLTSAAYVPGRRQLVSAGRDGRILLWDLETAQVIREIRERVGGVAVTPDGRILASSGLVVDLWDLRSGKKIGQLVGPADPKALAFSRDGKVIAVREEKHVRVWDVATRKEMASARHGRLAHFALSPDGRLLALAGYEGPLTLCDTATGTKVVELNRQERYVRSVAFAPDGRTLMAGGHGWLEFWETATGNMRLRIEREGLTAAVVAFAPDGQTLAVGGHLDRTIHLLDAGSGKEIRRLVGHRGGMASLCFAADGKELASASRDTTILLWDLRDMTRRPVAFDNALGADMLEQCWRDLAKDAATAFQAQQRLRGAPEAATKLLKNRVQPIARIRPEQLDRLIADLGNEQFAIRDGASKQLEKLDGHAAAALRRALPQAKLEARRRIERLLARFTCPSVEDAELVRMIRSVEILEMIATADARKALRTLADGAPGHRLTEEARGSVARLARLANSPRP